MERKLICHFCLIYFVLFFFCTYIERTHFSSSVPLWPFIFFWKHRHLCENQRSDSCQFCCFRTNTNFEKKKRKKRPVPFFFRSLLEQWWTSQMISGYCLVLVPYLSSTFPKHGLYIHDYSDVHSPQKAGRSAAWREHFFDAAASSSQQTVLSPLYFPNGTFLISVKLLQ